MEDWKEKFNNFISVYIAVILIGLMGIIMLLTAAQDSLTFDEVAHIGSGYSYLTQKDYRSNPEHPPLMKDLAGLPLLFLNIKDFSKDSYWTDFVPMEGQWALGREIIFESPESSKSIIYWSRFPLILVTLLLAWFVFRWTKELYGGLTGLIALLFFVFSPNIIAHGRLVTTDVAASFGFFFALYYYLKFLTKPSKKHLVYAGLAFGIAQLIKFSLFLLVPFYIFIAGILVFMAPIKRPVNNPYQLLKKYAKRSYKYFKAVFAIMIIGYLVVWPVYQFHTWGYPAERQVSDARTLLSTYAEGPTSVKEACPFTGRCPAEIAIWMSDKPLLRPYGQYLLGLLMVVQRSAGGNTTYFWGEISASGWWYYFPVVFLWKVPLGFLFLLTLAFLMAIWKLACVFTRDKVTRHLPHFSCVHKDTKHPNKNFVALSLVLFIFYYWIISMRSNLNIGIRHVLPTFPFMYLLVSRQITYWWRQSLRIKYNTILDIFKQTMITYFKISLKTIFIVIMVLWIIVSALSSYPRYISYFNETVGGPKNGHKYVTDSNSDWGQDLHLLKDFVDDNGISKINLSYFGGEVPAKMFGDKFEPWWPERGRPQGWFAISATLRQETFAKATGGFVKKPENAYSWLIGKEPITLIGDSIFVYYFK